MTVKLLHGECRELMSEMDEESVDCVITSPPYFRHRDYGHDDQIGQEPSAFWYVHELRMTFVRIKRILKQSGTVWLNMGDRYDGKQLAGLPWQTALALQKDGWLLRSDIIWHKPNAMPESAKDRPTKGHEYLFLLTKSANYYYNAEAVREPCKWERWGKQTMKKDYRGIKAVDMSTLEARRLRGRNRRTVWSVPTGRYPGAHFAVMPEKLVEPCILAGCPEDGMTLDPFVGVGTVCVVAEQLGRNSIGIDINNDYLELAKQRLQSWQ